MPSNRSPARGALEFSIPPVVRGFDSLKPHEPSLREQIAQFFADRAADLGADRSMQQYIADKIAGAADLAPAVGEVLGMDDAYREYMQGNYGNALATLGLTAVGAVPLVGDVASKAGKEAIRAADGFRAFHGSAADFDKFDMGKIGSGTGYQNEGRGFYFTDSRDIAEGYRDGLKGDKDGKVYEVGVRADPSSFYDLDKPLSQQTPAVRDAFEREFSTTRTGRPLPGQSTPFVQSMPAREPRAMYSSLASPEFTSRMQKAGIPGTTWRSADQNAQGARNYAVFDPDLIDIVSKYGIAGASAVLGYDVLSGMDEAQAAELESYAPAPGVDPMTTQSTKSGVANDFAGLLMGEAGGDNASERYNDMLHIASVVVNRAAATGRPVEDIMANAREFNAWGKALPAGAEQFRGLAEQAIQQVMEHGSVTNATFYATPSKTDNLPSGLQAATRTASHEFFTDPQNRAIGTASGYAQVHPVNAETVPPLPLSAPTPFGSGDRRMMAFEPPYAGLVPPTAAPVAPPAPAAREITPGLGLANLVPEAPPVSGARGSISYAHPDRGSWDAGLTPDTAGSVQMLAGMSPTGVDITSAYRSPNHPVEARKAAPGQHAQGTAYDLNLRGLSDQERANMVEHAMMTGATRLGSYASSPNMLHVDFAKGFAPTNGSVYAMHDRSNRNMANAPDWFTRGLSQVTVPTPTPRPDITPPPAPNFAGGISPVPAPSPMPNIPAMPYAPPAPTVNFPTGGYPTIPQPGPPAREAQEMSMGMYNLAAPSIDAMLGDRQPVNPALAVPALPSLPPAVPQNVIDAYTEYGRSRAAAPQMPAVPPSNMLAPPMSPPTPMAPAVETLPPAPTPSPRNGWTDAKRGAMIGGLPGAVAAPAIAQIGRNARSNMQGQHMGLFDGIRQAYRDAGQGFAGLFGGPMPAPSPFSIGTGLGAIQSILGGGMAPGATAYSASAPGASWSVNAYGLPEYTSQHGFTGVMPDNAR